VVLSGACIALSIRSILGFCCGTEHDRDDNASLNIEMVGMEHQHDLKCTSRDGKTTSVARLDEAQTIPTPSGWEVCQSDEPSSANGFGRTKVAGEEFLRCVWSTSDCSRGGTCGWGNAKKWLLHIQPLRGIRKLRFLT